MSCPCWLIFVTKFLNMLRKLLLLTTIGTMFLSTLKGQTYFNLSGGNYTEDFNDIANTTNWPNGFGGSSSAEWGSVATNATGSIPSANRISAATASFVSGSTGGVQRGTENIQLLTTGSTDNTSSAAIDLFLNFTNRNADSLKMDLACVFNSTGNRVGSLRLYFSIDNANSWTEITGGGLPFSATNNVAASQAVALKLPGAMNGEDSVRLRFYYHNGSGGSTGSRPKISIDNISITTISAATPTLVVSPTSHAFGNSNINSPSSSQTFALSGTSLTGAPGNITITPPSSDFQVSTDNSSFSSSINIAYSSASLSSTNFYVRFNPQSGGAKSGNLGFTGGGVTSPPTISVSGTGVTNYYTKTGTATALQNTSSWTTNASGGAGTEPSDFTSNAQIFNIANNTTTTISGNWTVSGTGSKIVVSSGDFTIPSGNTVTATIDVNGGAELTIENATLPTFGTLAANSTVQYNNVSLTLPASTTYGNLTLSGTGTKTFPGNTTTVTGNLVIDNTTIDAPGASPFATILLAGNLTYQGTVTNPIDANSITLQTNGSASGTQTITANGNTVRYFRIQTTTANTLLMSTTGGSSNILVGNSASGGITLLDGSVLNLNGNDLTFLAGGGASLILNTTGSISGGAQTDLTFARGGTATLGTLRMTSGSNTVRSLTLNHSGSSNTTLTLGNAINVTENVTLTAGTLASAGNLTLKSTSASATARVEGGTNTSITGNVTVERFLPWTSANNNGFRFVGHPLRSNPVINTVTNLPSATNTLIGYNEAQNAYEAIANRTATWPQAIGYGVWTDAATTLSFTGELQLNDVGPISLTNSNQRWHYLANPFPSVLDWNAVSRTDMANAVYIWEKDNSAEGSGAWGSFVDGVSANNGSRYLAPGQGFMVRTNASGSPAITFPAAARSTASNPSFYRQQNVVGDVFRVRVSKPSNQTSMETVIRFRNQATATFDNEYDAAFVSDLTPASPDLYTTDANGNKYSIQALPEITNQGSIVSLGLETFGAGLFHLNFNGSEMQTLAQVRLEDQLDGSFRNITPGQTISISTGAQDVPGRFRLHFNTLSTSVADAVKSHISIYTFEGALYVNGAERGDLRITDLIGRMVYQQNGQEFGQALWPNLAKGAYLVQVYTSTGSQIVKVIF